MKKNFALLLVLTSFLALAQPAGYYNTATGTGYTLKTQLKNIIDNNTNANGTADYGDLWILYTNTAFRDNYYENNGSLLDIYSERPTGSDSYEFTSTTQQCGGTTPSNEGACYNREHTMPQSVFDSNYPMYSDAHFVLPTDNRVNGWRNNFPFGKVVTSTAIVATNSSVANAANIPVYTTNQSRLGQNLNSGYSSGYSGVVFEPIDEFKGDIARAMLYFATRYETQIPSWTYSMFDGSSTKVFSDTFLNILITWHNSDPVSAYEIAKNNAVYAFQGNRNPFIDNPAYVCQIWSATCTALSTEDFAITAISVYPNPTLNNEVYVATEMELKSIVLYNVNGQIIQEIKNPSKVENNTYKVSDLPKGFYLMQLVTENASTIKKLIVN